MAAFIKKKWRLETMAKYFKKVKSYSDLKSQFKTLLKANHPDNGGDIEHFEQLKKEKTGVIFEQDIERARWER